MKKTRQKKKLYFVVLQKFCERALTEEKAAVRRLHQRVGGAAEHLGPAAKDLAQIGFAGVALAHFQKTGGEIGARQRIIGTQGQRVPEGLFRGVEFAFQQQHAPQRGEDIGAPRARRRAP